jgi:alpha-ketoglutaric semialdehyde dehydrogenase
MNILGKSLIGFQDAMPSGDTFQAFNPATGEKLETAFYAASSQDVDRAARLATDAFPVFSQLRAHDKAAFLKRIASEIEANLDQIVAQAQAESSLPIPRLKSETWRTIGQLRLFADVVEEGSWVMARIDHADAQRKPLPKPDVRSMWHGIGPVVVFGASNFPLAFSVAGGDTASAFAAGNPVIVKAHPAHPATSELVGRAIRESVRAIGLPEGVFSLLFDSGNYVGGALVQHPLIKAAGFTGSTAGGRALMNLAVSRPDPIPFYGEMGSTNPLFILPGALAARGREIASQLHGSFTLGAGQFCTKPGMVFVPESDTTASFFTEFQAKVSQSPKLTLLTSGIRSAYQRESEKRVGRTGVAMIAEGEQPSSDPAFFARVQAFETDVTTLLDHEDLSAELFGPSTLLIRYSQREQILQAARNLNGHLTATIHGTEEDLREFSELIQILRGKVGRLVFNGYPTGVEVCHAMIHGGPYPASTDSRTTSVGTQAIYRFARPVCYQDFPDAALPDELKNGNPLGLFRMVDGQLGRQ